MKTKFAETTVDQMRPGKPIVIDLQATAGDALTAMQSHSCSCVVVTNQGALEGIVTERDVLQKLVFAGVDPSSLPVSNIMTRQPAYLFGDDCAAFALNEMSVLECRHITVVDKSRRPCGILTIEHVLETLESDLELRPSAFHEPISILQPPEPLCLEKGISLQVAIEYMVERNFGSILIVRNKKLVGILTERDILYKVAGKVNDTRRLFVEEFMTSHPHSLSMHDEILSAIRLFRENKIRHIPIVNPSDEAVGFISVRGVIDYMVSFFAEDIINLPPNPLRVGLDEAAGA